MSEKKIIVDTNLLLLFVVGCTDKKLVPKYNWRLIPKNKGRVSKYDVKHFEILIDTVLRYTKIVVTPHILAEFWNLMGEDRGGWDIHTKKIYKTALSVIRDACEIRDPAKDLIERTEIRWLGIADVSLLEAAEKQGYSLITADGPLYAQAMNLGIETYNIWHIWDRYFN